MDIGTGLALLGSSQLINRLLGPSADYIGSEIKQHLAEKGLNNLKNIFSIAINRLGNKIETEGGVPPKVLRGILIEGPYCDDPLSAEYFGGVLASSRSGVSRDDRGATFIALLSRLSTYQIRTHYVFYRVIKDSFNGKSFNVGLNIDREKMETHIYLDTYLAAMEFDERENSNVIISHVLSGLVREDLIESEPLGYGNGEFLRKIFISATKPGIIFQPSSLGVELFLWAHGRSDLSNIDFLKAENQLEMICDLSISEGYEKTQK